MGNLTQGKGPCYCLMGESLHKEASNAGKMAGDLFIYAACHKEGFEHARACCQQMAWIFSCKTTESIRTTIHAANMEKSKASH